MPFHLHSNVVYKFLEGRCNATSYGKTCHYLKVGIDVCSSDSHLTEKCWKLK